MASLVAELAEKLNAAGNSFTIDESTIVVDTLNNRVGIGASPTANALEVSGTASAQVLKIDNINIDGNTISSTDTDGDINLIPNGNGNVGIGTISPAYKLETRDSDISVVKLAPVGSGITVDGIRFRIINSSAPAQSATLGMVNAEAFTGWGGVLIFSTKPANGTPNESVTERMRIDSSGNVGIGTSSPATTLDVNGDATINGITVGRGGGNVVNNTAVGVNALAANSGSQNTACGNQALLNNTSGTYNTAHGANALVSNTNGNDNTAVGRAAMSKNTIGTQNTAHGANALVSNTNGNYNTAVGYLALFISTGSYNTVIGNGSGSTITTGSKNTIIGKYDGNQGGLDIRTSDNNIVLSDGDGIPAYRANYYSDTSGYKHYWKPTFQGTATGYGVNAAANTWHRITAVDFNTGAYTNADHIRIILIWYNGNPTYGFSGRTLIEFSNHGRNSGVGYTTNYNAGGSDASGTSGYQLPCVFSSHTDTSSLTWEARLKSDSSNLSCCLEVKSNAQQTSNVGYTPPMYVYVSDHILN